MGTTGDGDRDRTELTAGESFLSCAGSSAECIVGGCSSAGVAYECESRGVGDSPVEW